MLVKSEAKDGTGRLILMPGHLIDSFFEVHRLQSDPVTIVFGREGLRPTTLHFFHLKWVKLEIFSENSFGVFARRCFWRSKRVVVQH